MNDKFDEMAKGMEQSATRRGALKKSGLGLVDIALALLFGLPANANDFKRGPLVEVSRPNPLSGCDDGFHPPGTATSEDTAQPFVAANQASPKNIVAVWNGSFAQSIVAGVTLDGGKNWQRVPIPGITLCTGGPFVAADDPWVSFGPGGDVYVISNPFSSEGSRAIAVNKSSDGGQHWSAPAFLAVTSDKRFVAQQPSLTADPTDARLVYAIWNRDDNGNRGQVMFARTTDGGRTWEPARQIYEPGGADSATLGHQIHLLPDGTLVDLFSESKYVFDASSNDKRALLRLIRSTDKGQTWSAPISIADLPLFNVVDPETGQLVFRAAGAAFDFAVDGHSGALYAVWEETRFGGGLYPSIAFATSTDGGLSWSAPIPVNKTPADIRTADRQAFRPSIAVAADGTIGVTYYDFRFNDPAAGVPTDYWLVHCHPSAAASPADAANWISEVRVTDESFDLEATFIFLDSFVLGKYVGLATAGNDFLSTFVKPDGVNVTSIFFRRVGP
jgi:hypothetical protein